MDFDLQTTEAGRRIAQECLALGVERCRYQVSGEVASLELLYCFRRDEIACHRLWAMVGALVFPPHI